MANITGVNPPALNDVDYVDKITNSFNVVDTHDHSSGKGVPITATGLADEAVTTAKLADNAVQTNKIGNLIITTGKIGNVQVTNEKIANTTITNEKISASAAIAYSKLNLAASVNMASDVTGILPLANGGTGSATKNFVDITTAQTIAGSKKFTNAISGTHVDVSTVGVIEPLALPTSAIVSLSNATELRTIAAGASGQVLILTNINISDVLIINEYVASVNKIYTGTESDLNLKPNASVFLYYNSDIEAWCVIGGSGGGAVSNNTFSTFMLTATSDAVQKWRYLGPPGSNTMVSINFSLMPDGGRLIMTGDSNENVVIIPLTLGDVYLNGPRTLARFSSIEFVKDDTALIEVSRNGI